MLIARCTLRIINRRAFASMSQPKLIVVVGATGTGKSDLAVELARRFNGEVLNADAMQLYKGLPIITNKIAIPEQKGVPHHLLGCIDLHEQPWTVGNFVDSALTTIAGIHDRGRLPIMVGGTHYYIQSLLFPEALSDGTSGQQDDAMWTDEKPSVQLAVKWPILTQPPSEILAKLNEVDPVMARRWHPNDHRKIKRSLEIYLQTGRRASDIYEEQRQARENNGQTASDAHQSAKPSSLRKNTLILWIHADTAALYPRLDARVEKMLAAGLLKEVQELSAYASAHPPVDQSSGIWVSIGYKEFLPYTTRLADPSAAADDKDTKALLQQAVEATQAGTRQYAKSQMRWIRIKLLDALDAASSDGGSSSNKHLYVLDGDDISAFRTAVVDRAAALVETFLAGEEEEMPDPATYGAKAAAVLGDRSRYSRTKKGLAWERQECDVCGVVGATESDWLQHVASKRHKKAVAKAKTANGGGGDRHLVASGAGPREGAETTAGLD